jgi:hypothetical protein
VTAPRADWRGNRCEVPECSEQAEEQRWQRSTGTELLLCERHDLILASHHNRYPQLQAGSKALQLELAGTRFGQAISEDEEFMAWDTELGPAPEEETNAG